jgi:hypothetical protein
MEQTKAPDTNPSEEWTDLPWRKLEQHLYRLQKRMCAMRRTEVFLA